MVDNPLSVDERRINRNKGLLGLIAGGAVFALAVFTLNAPAWLRYLSNMPFQIGMFVWIGTLIGSPIFALVSIIQILTGRPILARWFESKFERKLREQKEKHED